MLDQAAGTERERIDRPPVRVLQDPQDGVPVPREDILLDARAEEAAAHGGAPRAVGLNGGMDEWVGGNMPAYRSRSERSSIQKSYRSASTALVKFTRQASRDAGRGCQPTICRCK